jgi:hypothetical protein
MKRYLALLILAFAAVAHGQAHQVTLTWTASASSTPANPGTVMVWRATGNCPASGIGTLSYTAIAGSQPPAGSYVDTTVSSGTTYCYYVVAVIGGATSLPSDTFQGVIPAAVVAPPVLSGVVK